MHVLLTMACLFVLGLVCVYVYFRFYVIFGRIWLSLMLLQRLASEMTLHVPLYRLECYMPQTYYCES